MTEEKFREVYYEKAKKVTDWAGLVNLLKELHDFKYDYGTCVLGAAASMKATFNWLNRTSLGGGITGFQASCVAWEMLAEFMSIKGPARIVQYENMLYPQYADKFDKTITFETWETLKKKAEENLTKSMNESVHPNVVAHWKTIVAGEIPFGYRVEAE